MRSCTAVVALSFMFLVPVLAGAQAVRGAVVDLRGQPIAGVVVLLLDSAQSVSARALSDSRGSFRIANSRSGTYRLRTLRIGYRPTTGETFTLALGEEITQRVTLTGVQVMLDTMRVADERVCRIAGDSATMAFAVWEQARTALAATELTTSQRALIATTVTYERLYDPELTRVRQQAAQVHTDSVAQPWNSLSPDSLHVAGYVARDSRSGWVIYRAPGLDALLSPMFAEDHCFNLATSPTDPTRIGVAFEPTRERKDVPEVSGTLWLDRRTSELRDLEYEYTNIPRTEAEYAGGAMAFARLGTGAWVISGWNIRMPVTEAARTRVVSDMFAGREPPRVTGVKVSGGELALARGAADSLSGTTRDTLLWVHPPVTLAGVVTDSASGKGVAGARVLAERDTQGAEALAGAAGSAQSQTLAGISNSDGQFTIAGLVPGDYMLQVRTPALDSVGIAVRVAVTVVDSAVALQVRLPTAPGATIAGRVLRDSTRVPVIDAEVLLPELHRGTRTDSAGEFRMERIPAGEHELVVRRVGYGPLDTVLTFRANRTVSRTIYLTRGVALDPVVVEAQGTGIPTFDDHRAVGLGHFFARAELEKFDGQPLTNVLSNILGLRLVYDGQSKEIHVGNSRTGCLSQVYIDHVMIFGGVNNPNPGQRFDVTHLRPDDYETIEYYAGPAQTPAEYSGLDSPCGVLVLWTRRPDRAPEEPPAH